MYTCLLQYRRETLYRLELESALRISLSSICVRASKSDAASVSLGWLADLFKRHIFDAQLFDVLSQFSFVVAQATILGFVKLQILESNALLWCLAIVFASLHVLDDERMVRCFVELESLAIGHIVELFDIIYISLLHTEMCLHVQLDAHFTKRVKCRRVRNAHFKLSAPSIVVVADVLPPRKVLVVFTRILVQIDQKVSQLFGRLVVEHIYVTGFGHVFRVVAKTEHDWHDVVVERAEELLGDVFTAQRVLEGEKELVLCSNVSVTISFIIIWARQLATLAVHVHFNIFSQFCDKLTPVCRTSANYCRRKFYLQLNFLSLIFVYKKTP